MLSSYLNKVTCFKASTVIFWPSRMKSGNIINALKYVLNNKI